MLKEFDGIVLLSKFTCIGKIPSKVIHTIKKSQLVQMNKVLLFYS